MLKVARKVTLSSFLASGDIVDKASIFMMQAEKREYLGHRRK